MIEKTLKITITKAGIDRKNTQNYIHKSRNWSKTNTHSENKTALAFTMNMMHWCRVAGHIYVVCTLHSRDCLAER